MNETRGIPWLRLGAESVAIVGSILLAFAIDAWWADSQETEQARLLLTALKAEAQQNLLQLDVERAYRTAALESATRLLSASAGDTDLDLAELDQMLGSVMWWGYATWSTGVVAGLIESGGLALIDSGSLRSIVAALPEQVESVRREELAEFDSFRNVTMPFLHENALVTQLNNAQLRRPGVGDYPQPVMPIGEHRDHRYLLEDSEFLGIVAHRIWDQSDALSAYANFEQTSRQLIRAIDDYLM